MKFKVGDRVIVNPKAKVGTYFKSTKGAGFSLYDFMYVPGIMVINSVEDDYYRVQTKDEVYCYVEEWLLPVPIFKTGDKVTVVSEFPLKIPFGLAQEMREFAGKTVTIEYVTQCSYIPNNLGEDGCKYSICEDHKHFSWPSSAFILNINLTTGKNENQLQEKRIAVSRGDKYSGSRICCRRCKATVTVGHLSYQEVSGD